MTCKLSAIVAVCEDWGIGCEGDMVVSNRADMRHFVACTKGCPVILGRKTLLGVLSRTAAILCLRAIWSLYARASTWCIALTKRSLRLPMSPLPG